MRLNLFKVLLVITMFSILGCNSEPKIPTSQEVKILADKVANWQIETFEDMGVYRALPSEDQRKNWHNRDKHHELEWTNAALYAGLYEWAATNPDVTYEKWLYDIGVNNKWKLYKRLFHADDHAVGQMYLKMKELYGHPRLIKPMRKQFDSILGHEQVDKMHWDWADALFMAPPVWARLARATGEKKYLDFMDKQYRKTYNALWDKEEHLFFRDKSFVEKKEKNGEKLFWSRGNGWVYGGLALMIPDLPDDWEKSQFYIDIFKQMSLTLKSTQRKDGTWSSGLLGGEDNYPVKEISGSAFFVYGLAWGINQGILDAKTYEPIMLKGWQALTECVTPEGLVGYIQPIGAAPGNSYPNYTEVYGVGAFLAASAEIYKFAENKEAVGVIAKPSSFTTFMEDGGWCWYQDPRAIINSGKLIFGGLSGQSGDVKIGVYNLENNTNEGTIVLDKNFQVDDHDVPALYARPDGSILAMWAKHANEKKHYYSISSVSNYLDWGDKKEFVHNYKENKGVTYMNLYYMEDEKLLYNFFRDGPSFNPTFITSQDYGETWSSRSSHFIEDEVEGRQRPYARYFQKDENTVGISFTDGHPRQYGNSLYYAEFSNGSFYNVDGTKIKDFKGPLKTTEAEKVYKGSETKKKSKGFESVPNSSWSCATGKDSENNPHMGYSLYLSNDDHRFRIASWNGKKWIDREIAYAGKCLYTMESSYTGLMAFDPEDVSQVYISTDVNPSTGKDLGGLHEIYTAKIGLGDDISTIKWKAITSNSKYRNIRPIVVANEGHKVLLWLNGPWNSFVNYKADVKGIVLSNNKK